MLVVLFFCCQIELSEIVWHLDCDSVLLQASSNWNWNLTLILKWHQLINMKTNSQYLNIYSLVDYYHDYYYHNNYITSSVANIIPLKKKNKQINPIQSTPCTNIMVLSGTLSSLSDPELESSWVPPETGTTDIWTSDTGRRPWPGIIALERLCPCLSSCPVSQSVGQSVSQLVIQSICHLVTFNLAKRNQWCQAESILVTT